MRSDWRAWVGIAIAGAVSCTVGDHLHVVTGVLAYPRPAFFGEAWWVPLLFAVASVVIVGGAGPVRAALGGRAVDAPPRRIAADGIAFLTAYAFTAYGHALPDVVLAVLVAAWLARMVAAGSPWLIVYSLLVAAGGTLFESGWSHLGFFDYRVPDFIGVPRWLPALYLHVALLTSSLARLVEAPSPD